MGTLLDKTGISGEGEDDWELINSIVDNDSGENMVGWSVCNFQLENLLGVWFRRASVREIIAP